MRKACGRSSAGYSRCSRNGACRSTAPASRRIYSSSALNWGSTACTSGVTEAPVWAEDQKSSETVIQTGMGICRSSQQQELAWEFIRFAAGAEGAKIMAAKQMMPAYLDSEVEEIYRNSFYGAYLDPMVYLDRETAVGAYQDTSREQEILCDAFRQSVTGQKDIDMALRNAQREIEALSS